MTDLNIIMVIAIILFARLGVRLFSKWQEISNSTSDQGDSQKEEKPGRKTDQLDN